MVASQHTICFITRIRRKYRAERRDRFWMMANWYATGRIAAAQLNELLADWWPDTEWVSGYATTPVVRLFRAAGFVTDRPGTAPPTTVQTVYRGAASKGQGGVSWTLDQTTAAWFAARRQAGGEDGRVYVAEIAPQGVLAIFHARQENELVINPRHLQHLRERDGQPTAGEGSCFTHPGLGPG